MTRDAHFELERPAAAATAAPVRVVSMRIAPEPRTRPAAQRLTPRPCLSDALAIGGGLGRALVIDLRVDDGRRVDE